MTALGITVSITLSAFIILWGIAFVKSIINS